MHTLTGHERGNIPQSNTYRGLMLGIAAMNIEIHTYAERFSETPRNALPLSPTAYRKFRIESRLRISGEIAL